MNQIMGNRLTLWAVLCCIHLTTLSGSHAQGANEEVKDVGQSFRVTLFNEWNGPDLFVKAKKSYALLEAHKMSYTKPYRYLSGKPIVVYTKMLTAEGEEQYIPYARFPVTAKILEPLLVLHWDAKANKAGGKVLEFSARKFGYGSYQLVNLSESKVLGYIGDQKKRFSCGPKSEYISNFTFENGARTPIAVYTVNGRKVDLVFSTLTIHRERKRVILFLHAEKNKLGRMVYRSQSLVDFKNEEK